MWNLYSNDVLVILMFFLQIIMFAVGIYAGIYIDQNYQVPCFICTVKCYIYILLRNQFVHTLAFKSVFAATVLSTFLF